MNASGYSNTVAPSATVVRMENHVSVRELRNETASVVARVESGETMTLTVNRRPVAEIVPLAGFRDPWVPSNELRTVVRESSADPGLLTDIDSVRGDLIEE